MGAEEGEEHTPGLLPSVAKLFAGDKLVVVRVDTTQWKAPLRQMQVAAPAALFVGPFGVDTPGYIAKMMPTVEAKDFTPYVVEYFALEARKSAGAAVEAGAVDEAGGLMQMAALPDLGGGRKRGRKGRKARRQAKLEAEGKGGEEGAAEGAEGEAGGGESWLEL